MPSPGTSWPVVTAARPLLPLLVFVACGLCDAGVSLNAGRGGFSCAAALVLLPVVALWVLTGLVVWAGFALLLWLWLPASTRLTLRARALDYGPQLWRARRTRASRRQAAWVLGMLSGVACWASASVAIAIDLIENRHGPELIAVTLVALQLPLAAAAVWVGLALRRALLTVGDAVTGTLPASSLLSAPVVLGALLLLGAAFAGLAAQRHRETLVAVDAGALALAVVAVLGFLIAWACGARAPHVAAVSAVALVCVAALVGGLRGPDARRLASGHTLVAKYVVAGLRDWSDFDTDGAPWFPDGDDCAPFDASRHPFVLEKPHNGIDENCDGEDDFSLGLVKPQQRKRPSRVITPKPNLVLITVDATRADHMGFMGYRVHPTTPELDAFAKRSTIFAAAFSQDSGTGPSLWSLMTGRTPFQVKFASAARFPFAIGQEETTLAEHLSRAGYETSAVLCGSMFRSTSWNIRRGFDRYEEVCGKRVTGLSEQTAARAIARLDMVPEDRPFFLWVHLLDPHHPYTDHAGTSFGAAPIDRYDEEIRAADAAVARMLSALRGRNTDRGTYVALSADHGENFGEHGNTHHARTLYREVTHVPLLVSGPGVQARRVDAPVAAGDLYPTFLELAGLPVPARCTMTSQFNVLFGAGPDRTRLVFQENSFSRPVRHVKAVVSDRYHLLFDTSNHVLELYAWRKDPKESLNLYGLGEADENRLRQALLVFLTTTKLPVELRK